MSLNSDPNSLANKGKSFLKSAAGRQINIMKRRIIRGLGLVVIAALAWVANQMGLISDKSQRSETQTTESSQTSQTQDFEKVSGATKSTETVQTLRLEDNHVVTDETKVVKTRKHDHMNDNALIAKLYQQKKSDTWVTAYGHVGKLLPDDNKGSRHQRFLLDIGQKKWLLIAHNIDLAPYVPLKKGDRVIVHGEYEYNDKGGVIHWTHHDPRGYKDGGYIELNNKRYE